MKEFLEYEFRIGKDMMGWLALISFLFLVFISSDLLYPLGQLLNAHLEHRSIFRSRYQILVVWSDDHAGDTCFMDSPGYTFWEVHLILLRVGDLCPPSLESLQSEPLPLFLDLRLPLLFLSGSLPLELPLQGEELELDSEDLFLLLFFFLPPPSLKLSLFTNDIALMEPSTFDKWIMDLSDFPDLCDLLVSLPRCFELFPRLLYKINIQIPKKISLPISRLPRIWRPSPWFRVTRALPSESYKDDISYRVTWSQSYLFFCCGDAHHRFTLLRPCQ